MVSCLRLVAFGLAAASCAVADRSTSLRGAQLDGAVAVNSTLAAKDLASYRLTIGPGWENQKVDLGGPYTGGKLEVWVQSASVAPGIITSMYLSTGAGRTGAGGGNGTAGTQDEIDLEWKGNTPTEVQTNVFLTGEEDLVMIPIGGDGSAAEHLYGFEWDDKKVIFTLDRAVVRTYTLSRPLGAMWAHFSVWTTSGGWPGLIRWAGPMDWSVRGGMPTTATFRVITNTMT